MSGLGSKFEFRIVALCCVVAACLIPARKCSAQSQVFVSYEDEMLPVVAMDGATPLISLNGQLVAVVNANVRVEPAPEYLDGSLEVLERNATIGRDFGSHLPSYYFRFDAKVQAERDFVDCFALFIVRYAQGEEAYYIREIRDINATGTEKIVVTLPIDAAFGEGAFSYRVFSGGREIRRYETEEQIVVKDAGGISGPGIDASGSAPAGGAGVGEIEPAKAIKARLLDFPKSLAGKVSGGYAMAVFSIGEEGSAVELLELRAEELEFVPEVWKTIFETRYRPGTFNGKPMLTRVRQNFFFNEFAPFAEGLEILPHSDLEPRQARPIYAPEPSLNLEEDIVLKFQVLVDKLGRVAFVAAVDSVDAEVAEAALETIRDWIFLPTISEGRVTEQRFVIPIRFSAAK